MFWAAAMKKLFLDCTPQSIITRPLVKEQNTQCGLVFCLLNCYCSHQVLSPFFILFFAFCPFSLVCCCCWLNQYAVLMGHLPLLGKRGLFEKNAQEMFWKKIRIFFREIKIKRRFLRSTCVLRQSTALKSQHLWTNGKKWHEILKGKTCFKRTMCIFCLMSRCYIDHFSCHFDKRDFRYFILD